MSAFVRRQITAFLPAEVGTEVDKVRARWDPVMADRISAHITLVHEAADDLASPSALDAIRDAGPMLIRLADVQCWGTPEGGIYVGVRDVRGDVALVRDMLGAAESPSMTYVPHVTVVHPRTVPAATLHEAWSALAAWTLDAEVVLDTVSLIELVETRWRLVDEVALAPPGSD